MPLMPKVHWAFCHFSARHLPARNACMGVGLIEVLITVAVIAVGLLGLTALQLVGFGAGRSTLFYTHASTALDDMVNRMYLNTAGVVAGHYNGVSVDSTGAGIPAAPSCAPSCSVAGLAQLDIREWGGYFFDINGMGSNYTPVMPDGAKGKITRHSPNSYTVSISWEEDDLSRLTSKVTRTVEMQVRF